MFARAPEDGNCAVLLERVGLARRPHLPCPSRWICAPRRIMATTSQNEAARELFITVRLSCRAGQERERQGRGGLEGIRTMRDASTSCPRRWRVACLIGCGCTGDIVIAPMKQITLLARAAVLYAVEKSDEFTVSIGCGPRFRWKREAGLSRSARHDPRSLRGRVGLGGFLHRRFNFDVRPLNRWKNSRSRLLKRPLVVLID